MDFDRIMAIGANVIPDQKHFEVFAKDITKSQADLLVFSELIDDLEVLVNNVLVKDIYGERRPKDSSNRSKQLLLQGIVDPQLKN